MLEALSPHLVQATQALLLLTTIAFAVRLLRLPVLTAYLLAGVGLRFFLNFSTEGSLFKTVEQASFIVLIFLVGLELNWQKARAFFRTSSRISLGLLAAGVIGGILLGKYTHLPFITSVLFGLALSSTSGIAGVKLLSDSHDTDSLHGRLTLGMIFFQDMLAIACLTLLGGYIGREGLTVSTELSLVAIRVISATLILWYLSRSLLPKLFHFFKDSGELTLLLSLAWCFGGTLGFRSIDIPIEAGALISGLLLADSPYLLEVTARLRPIRDLLILAIFFIFGARVHAVPRELYSLAAFSFLFVVFVRPALTFFGLALRGYRNRPSILSALLQAPLSEYAVVFALLAVQADIEGAESILSVITMVLLSSMLTSSLYFASRNHIVRILSPLLRPFERGRHRSPELITGDGVDTKQHYVLFGYHRMGFHILQELQRMKKDVVVIDFNPEIVKKLRTAGVSALYGDVEDETIYEAAQVQFAEVVISTIPLHHETRYLLKTVQKLNPEAAILVTAKQAKDALQYYEEGADYVVMPHLTTSSHLAELIHSGRKIGLKQSLSRLHHQQHLEKTVKQPLYEG